LFTDVLPMTEAAAREISSWRYDGAYCLYNFEPGEGTLRELLRGDYFFCPDEEGNPAGYFCFGVSARIPTEDPHAYTLPLSDIGLGLAPSLCGRGLGGSFLRRGLKFASERFTPAGFRLTVASFNRRALRVYEKAGFHTVRAVTHAQTRMEFQIMVRSLP